MPSVTLCLCVAELNTKGSTDTCSVFLGCLSESRELLPDVELLLEAAEKIHPANRRPVHMMLLLLMMASSVANKPTPAVSQRILDMAVSYFEQCQVQMCDISVSLSTFGDSGVVRRCLSENFSLEVLNCYLQS
jgi:hypothetical protein